MKYLMMVMLLVSSTGFAAAEVGKKAPDFTATGHDGKTYKLSDFKSQYVVLEWYNAECPYVRKHYDSKNMQTLQKKITGDKNTPVVWFTVSSSAEGKQGYLTPEAAVAQYKKEGMNSKAILLDAEGTIGKAYGAKTTPHMFVIGPVGSIVYAGAIDSNSSSDPKDIPQSQNYVTNMLEDIKAKRNIATASTKAYGCGIKYAN